MSSRVIIVGAGFAGLPVARELAHRLKQTEVVLIDRRPFFQFSPRLIDQLASTDPIPALTAPLEPIAKRDGFRFLQGEVIAIDREQRFVTIQTSRKRERQTYDLLILATGSVINDFGIPGVQDHAFPLKSTTDVKRIHDHIRHLINKTKNFTTQKKRERLTISVIGAGAAGVEAIFALKQFAHAEAARIRPSPCRDLSFRLVEAASDILRGFPLSITNGVRRELYRHNITLHVNDPVHDIEDNAIIFASGDRLASGCTVWSAGIKASIPSSEPGLHMDQGCLATDRTLWVAPGIMAAGDVVCYREENLIIPKNAQTAMHMAMTLAHNAEQTLMGGPREVFSYQSRGNLLTLQHTGFIDVRLFTLKSRLAPFFRDLFYRWRFRQVTGNSN